LIKKQSDLNIKSMKQIYLIFELVMSIKFTVLNFFKKENNTQKKNEKKT
jgi:hypothetical protein